MRNPNEQHNTIMSGLRVEAARPEDSGVFSEVQPAVARRNSDGAKVLVTNLHIITGNVNK